MQRLKKYSFLLNYVIASLPLLGFIWGGWGFYLPLAIIFVGVPLVDHFIHDSTNPNEQEEKTNAKQFFYKALVLMTVPLVVGVLGYSLYQVSLNQFNTIEMIGLLLSVGIITTGGIGISSAHELLHKRTFIEQFASKILLSITCFGHYFIDHPRGHHVKVATPEDAVTARYNESIYRYFPRAIFGSFLSAWKLEVKRLQTFKYSLLSWRNQFWWIVFAPIIIFSAVYMWLGQLAALFFVGQAILAISILTIVDYIEHYGLERKKLPNGRYERVNSSHSWNANNWLTNTMLLQLQRHSDHHSRPEVPFQNLHHVDASPQLPSGYTLMVMMALCPPIWFAVMNPRVKAYQGASTSKNQTAFAN